MSIILPTMFFRLQHRILSNPRRSARQLPAAIEGEALNQCIYVYIYIFFIFIIYIYIVYLCIYVFNTVLYIDMGAS